LIKVILELEPEDFYTIVGHHEENLRKLAEILGVKLGSRGNEIMINGTAESEEKAKELKELEGMVKAGHKLTKADVDMYLTQLSAGRETKAKELSQEVIVQTYRGKKIVAKTPTQKRYVEAIRKNDVVFGVGPAGTGKTYLAVAMAVAYFRKGKVNRIILTRPAVRLGRS